MVSITATSLAPMSRGSQVGFRREHYQPGFTLRLSGGGVRGDTTISRPFILNPHVFDDKGKVIANARKGKLIALIESELYTASNFVRRLRLGLAVDFNHIKS